MLDRSSEGTELEIVDLRDEPDEVDAHALLQAFYQDPYLPAFPIASERESLATWESYLWGERRLGPAEMHVLVAGTKLRDTARRRIGGGMVFVIYPRSNCALLTYVVVSPSLRGQSLVHRLFAATMHILAKRGVRTVLGEVNDPTKVPAARDAVDPWQRLAIMQRLGGGIVDVPYVQPELAPGLGRCRELLLLAFPPPDGPQDSVASTALKAFLLEFYAELGVQQPGDDPDLLATLAAMVEPRVRLLQPEEFARQQLGRVAAERIFGPGAARRTAGPA